MEDGFLRCTARWRIPMDGGCINGNPKMEATAEGRLYNHSPRLACLPGVRAERINLPPKSGCINHGKYFSKLSQPSRHKYWRTYGTRDEKDALRVPGYGKVPSLRDDADVAMAFLQPHFGGSCVRHGVTV